MGADSCAGLIGDPDLLHRRDQPKRLSPPASGTAAAAAVRLDLSRDAVPLHHVDPAPTCGNRHDPGIPRGSQCGDMELVSACATSWVGWPSSISLALLGAVFITGILSGQISGNLDAIGLAAGFGNSVLFAAYLLVGARLQRHRDAPSLLMWATIGMTLGWSIIKPWWNYPWHKLTGSSMVFYDHGPVLPLWSMILFVAVVGTVLPFGLVLGSVARIGAQRGSIIGASEPIWAALIAFLALNELLGPMQLVGGALIVAAIVVGETWAMRANRHDEVDRI